MLSFVQYNYTLNQLISVMPTCGINEFDRLSAVSMLICCRLLCSDVTKGRVIRSLHSCSAVSLISPLMAASVPHRFVFQWWMTSSLTSKPGGQIVSTSTVAAIPVRLEITKKISFRYDDFVVHLSEYLCSRCAHRLMPVWCLCVSASHR